MTDAPWWIAISNTNCERRATQGLQDRGFEVWWPVRIAQVRVGPKREKRERMFPAFPGYLFTRHANPNAWPEMVGVDGLRAILCVDYTPMRVSNAEVERVRGELAPLEKSVAAVSLPVGSLVVITEGPMAGVRGLLTAVLKRGAMEVAVDLFGRSTTLKINQSILEVV